MNLIGKKITLEEVMMSLEQLVLTETSNVNNRRDCCFHLWNNISGNIAINEKLSRILTGSNGFHLREGILYLRDHRLGTVNYEYRDLDDPDQKLTGILDPEFDPDLSKFMIIDDQLSVDCLLPFFEEGWFHQLLIKIYPKTL